MYPKCLFFPQWDNRRLKIQNFCNLSTRKQITFEQSPKVHWKIRSYLIFRKIILNIAAFSK